MKDVKIVPEADEATAPQKIDLHSPEYAPKLGLPILLGMNKLAKPMYEGTVLFKTVAKRRAKNKAACKARRVRRLQAQSRKSK